MIIFHYYNPISLFSDYTLYLIMYIYTILQNIIDHSILFYQIILPAVNLIDIYLKIIISNNVQYYI